MKLLIFLHESAQNALFYTKYHQNFLGMGHSRPLLRPYSFGTCLEALLKELLCLPPSIDFMCCFAILHMLDVGGRLAYGLLLRTLRTVHPN